MFTNGYVIPVRTDMHDLVEIYYQNNPYFKIGHLLYYFFEMKIE